MVLYLFHFSECIFTPRSNLSSNSVLRKMRRGAAVCRSLHCAALHSGLVPGEEMGAVQACSLHADSDVQDRWMAVTCWDLFQTGGGHVLTCRSLQSN